MRRPGYCAALVAACFFLVGCKTSASITGSQIENLSPPTAVASPTAIATPTSAPTAAPTPTASATPIAESENDTTSVPVEIDPTNDDAEAQLRAAIADSRGADAITITKGTLYLDGALVITRDLHLAGQGHELTTITSSSPTALEVNGTRITLEGVSIESTAAGATEGPAPVASIHSARVSIDDVAVSNGLSHGLVVADSQGAINNSQFDNNGASGLLIAGDSHIEIADSSASNNEEGFSFTDTSFDRLDRTVAYDNRVAGYAWYDSSTAIANDPVAADNGHYGFFASGTSRPSLVSAISTGHTRAGAIWSDKARGKLVPADFSSNGTDFVVEDAADPAIEGRCPRNFAPVDDTTCEHRYQPTEYSCSRGRRLSGAKCIYEYEGRWRESCEAPYLLFEVGSPDHPTSPGGQGTCLWFDSDGRCPAGDTYVESNAQGTFSHRCARAPVRILDCGRGEVVTTVCQLEFDAGFVCRGATADPDTRECVERRDR